MRAILFQRGRRAAVSTERNRRATKSAGIGLVARVVQVAGTLFTMPLIFRALGQDLFGLWSAATSITWLSGLVDFGASFSLILLVGKTVGSGDKDKARQAIESSLKLGMYYAVILIIISPIIILTIVHPVRQLLYLVSIAALILSIPLGMSNSVWMGTQNGHISSLWETAQTLFSLGGVIFAMTIHVKSDALIYVSISSLGLVMANVGSTIHLFMHFPEYRFHLFESYWSKHLIEIAKFSFPYFFIGLANVFAIFGDNILALEFLGPDASAQMGIALRLCMIAMGFLVVISQPLLPAFTDALELGDKCWIWRHFLKGSLTVVGCSIVGALFILEFGHHFLYWWLGPQFFIFPKNVYLAIVLWIISFSMTRIPAILITAALKVRFQINLTIIHGLASIFFKIILIHKFGVAGILFGTALSNIVIIIPVYYIYLLQHRNDFFKI